MKTIEMKKRITSKISPEFNRGRIESGNVYTSLEPIYLVTVIMGLSPYIYNRFSKNPGYVSSKFLLFFCFCNLIIFYVVYVYTEFIHKVNPYSNSSLTAIMDIIHIHYNNILCAVIIVMACWQSKNVLAFLQRLSKIDEHFAQEGYKIQHNKIKFWISVYILLVFGVSIFLETMNCSYTWKRQLPFMWHCWFYCSYSMLLTSTMECQFLIYVSVLGNRFAVLNKQLFCLKPPYNIAAKSTTPNYNNDILKNIQKYHAALSDCCRLLNSIFSLQLLLDIGYIFLQGTLSYVHVFQKLANDFHDMDMVTTFIWGTYYISRLLALTKISSATLNEANNTGRIINNIHINISDKKTNHIILMFSRQLMLNKLNFTGFGFFPIDMTLFFTVIAAICLYILIIVQMDIDEDFNITNSTFTTITPITNINNEYVTTFINNSERLIFNNQ